MMRTRKSVTMFMTELVVTILEVVSKAKALFVWVRALHCLRVITETCLRRCSRDRLKRADKRREYPSQKP